EIWLDGDSVTFESLTPEQKSELTGHQGLSAYQVAVQEGFVGSEFEWLESLKGQDGINGTDGKSFDYDSLSPEQKLEIKGDKGDKGEAGVDGLHGNTASVENNEDGSYDIIVTNPNSETEISRTTVRDGVDGTNGTDGIDGKSLRYEDLTPEQIAELQEGLPVRPPKIYTRAEYD